MKHYLCFVLFILLLGFITFDMHAQQQSQQFTDEQLTSLELQGTLTACQARAEVYRRQVERLTKELADLKKSLESKESTSK